jgi:putative transposase
VKQLSRKHNVTYLCEVLDVSRSGYYEWCEQKPSKRAKQDAVIRQEIIKAHVAAPTYGVDNIHADVREKVLCGRNRVHRLMREMGIQSKRKRKYKATTNSRHKHGIAPNLVKNTKVKAPNQVWVGDITYIQTDEGWLYLAIVKDRFTREIVGYATGERITSELAQEALRQAITRYKPAPGLIFHSDRGVQYACTAYTDLLKQHNITASMSRKGNPYDNAVAENFFSCIKCEMVYLNHFKTRREAQLAIFRYIEGFYNRRRRHAALDRISPHKYRRQWAGGQGQAVHACASSPATTESGVKEKSVAHLDPTFGCCYTARQA